jgi:hypothetical protein
MIQKWAKQLEEIAMSEVNVLEQTEKFIEE